jgi:hypothetical protein
MPTIIADIYGIANCPYKGDHDETKSWFKGFNGGHEHNTIQSYDVEALVMKYFPGEDFDLYLKRNEQELDNSLLDKNLHIH